VFGIPLARFSDVWVRRSLISAGSFWSVMTAMPRTRAVTGAFFLLVNTTTGLAMSPYFVDQLFDV
jgi:hypothetical protein